MVNVSQGGIDPKPVVFVTQIMPHYRAGVYEYVAENLPGGAEWITGRSGADGNVAELDHSQFRVEFVENVWFGNFLWQKGLLSALRRKRSHAVVFVGDVHYLSTWSAALWLRLFSRTKVYFWTMGWRRRDGRLAGAVRMAFYRLAHGLLLYGNIGKEHGLRAGYPANKMHVIYNSLPTTKKATADRRISLPAVKEGTWTVGAVARLNPNKKFDLLIQAVRVLNDRGFHTRVVLGGDGVEKEAIAVLARALKIDCIFAGAIYDDSALTTIYDALDLTVVPGAIGLTAIQSLKFGTPVISGSDLSIQGPEVEAIRPGVGALVPLGSAESLADELARWFRGEKVADADACRAEFSAKWSPQASGRKIVEALVHERTHNGDLV